MTKMLFVEDDDVIKAISADGSDQSFGESIARAIEPISGGPVCPWQ